MPAEPSLEPFYLPRGGGRFLATTVERAERTIEPAVITWSRLDGWPGA